MTANWEPVPSKSEEGLEDVTALLLNISSGGAQTKETIIQLLLAGARELGIVVQSHASALLKELSELKTSGGLSAVKEDSVYLLLLVPATPMDFSSPTNMNNQASTSPWR